VKELKWLSLIGKKEEPARVPTADDFKARAVRKAVLSQTIQNPITLAPLSLCGASVLWILLIGFSLKAIGLCLLGGLLGFGAWVYNYFIRGEELAQRHIANLQAQREQSYSQAIEGVEQEFVKDKFIDGARAARDLTQAYNNLQESLSSQKAAASSAGKRFLTLAYDAHKEGVAVLRRALRIFQALQKIDPERMERELELLQRQLEQKEKEDATSAEIRSFGRRIESHNQSLERYQQRQDELRNLLDQCATLEGALERAYIEAIDLVETDSETLFGGDAAQRLEVAVEAARRVEDRLRGIDEYAEEDEMYSKAGRSGNDNNQ